ncbi:MAG: nitrous oxide reductase accessory protein NosL [Desulfobacterales bacterium]
MRASRLFFITTAVVMAIGMVGALSNIYGTQGEQPEDIVRFPSCPLCSMDRNQFAHSRVMVYYEDDSAFGACSIHCAAIDMAAKMGLTPERIDVADVATRQLIDADGAYWVLGGDLPGVMTRRAKWAFADSGSAEAFIRKHGGEMVDFETALKAAYEDMYSDTQMIRQKRKARMEKKGG